MKSWIAVALVAVIIPVGAVSFGSNASEDPKTEDIMKGLFKKGSGKFNTVLKKEVAATPTDWEAIQKTTKEIHELGESLEKAEPEKGDKESWTKMAGKFGEHTKELHEAAEAKDLNKVKAAQKSIGGSCKSCHDAHRGQ
jgi:cytochrome c556